VRQMHFQDSDQHVNKNSERSQTSEETKRDQDAAPELRRNYKVCHEGRQPYLVHHPSDHVHMVGNLLPAVRDHYRAQNESQHKEPQWLQSVQEVQSVLLGGRLPSVKFPGAR